MIIDMHYHLDERMEPLERLIGQMDLHRIEKVALIAPMVDPFHVEGAAEKLSSLVRKLLTAKWNAAGLVAYESVVTKNFKFKLLNKSYNIDLCPDNNVVLRAMEKYPDRFYGWYFINPTQENSVEKMEKEIASERWLGVKCHPFWHQFSLSCLDNIAAFCAERKIPVLIHLGGKKDNGDFRYLPERYPELKLIYAHAGVPHYQKLWNFVKDKKNVFVDLSSPYLDEALRRETVKSLGAEKCLYGTDGPFGYPAEDRMYDHGAILAEIDRLPVAGWEKDKILGENFMELLGL